MSPPPAIILEDSEPVEEKTVVKEAASIGLPLCESPNEMSEETASEGDVQGIIQEAETLSLKHPSPQESVKPKVMETPKKEKKSLMTFLTLGRKPKTKEMPAPAPAESDVIVEKTDDQEEASAESTMVEHERTPSQDQAIGTSDHTEFHPKDAAINTEDNKPVMNHVETQTVDPAPIKR